MADQLLTAAMDHCEVGRQLASISGVDLAKARPATVRAWEARGLALQALAQGDMAEATRIMDHALNRRSSGIKPAAEGAPKEAA